MQKSWKKTLRFFFSFFEFPILCFPDPIFLLSSFQRSQENAQDFKKSNEEFEKLIIDLKAELGAIKNEHKKKEEQLTETERLMAELEAKISKETQEKKKTEEALGKLQTDYETLKIEHDSTSESLDKTSKTLATTETTSVSLFFHSHSN